MSKLARAALFDKYTVFSNTNISEYESLTEGIVYCQIKAKALPQILNFAKINLCMSHVFEPFPNFHISAPKFDSCHKICLPLPPLPQLDPV